VIEGVVIIVEDAGPCATTLEIALTQLRGVTVRLAASAEEAQRLMSESQPVRAVITDLELPGEDGFTLIRWLRAQPSYAATPVVVVSGMSDPDAPHQALAAGANAYFTKPFSPAAVRRKLQELIHDE
jgi:DNA-binding response OmpR family regulator